MRIGDFVKWGQAELPVAESQRGGIIVDGPRDGSNGRGGMAISFAVHWFAHKETMWHNEYNLELLSENR